jgi:hypothetical protein
MYIEDVAIPAALFLTGERALYMLSTVLEQSICPSSFNRMERELNRDVGHISLPNWT